MFKTKTYNMRLRVIKNEALAKVLLRDETKTR